jgi:Protein of unknown function (DUF3175)
MAGAKTAQRHRASQDNRYWSSDVTRNSNALDLEHSVFTWRDPRRIARSLKSSAEASERRKASPYQSAMSMLNFYINRAGRKLPADRLRKLNRAKTELRHLFGRSEPRRRSRDRS